MELRKKRVASATIYLSLTDHKLSQITWNDKGNDRTIKRTQIDCIQIVKERTTKYSSQEGFKMNSIVKNARESST